MPEFWMSIEGKPWRKISREHFEKYHRAMEQEPELWEGVRMAIQYTLVVFK